MHVPGSPSTDTALSGKNLSTQSAAVDGQKENPDDV
jgi:hypothetical protein